MLTGCAANAHKLSVSVSGVVAVPVAADCQVGKLPMNAGNGDKMLAQARYRLRGRKYEVEILRRLSAGQCAT